MNKSITILIVEDEAITGMAIEMMLKKRGFAIPEIAATGKDAVSLARQFNPNAILMDIRLEGEIDGIEAAKEIRTFSQCPILFTTGYSDNEVKERALAISNSKYHVKPIDLNELISEIQSLL
jgi:two-component system, response regulator PdtaR